jgi:hypothetical protein
MLYMCGTDFDLVSRSVPRPVQSRNLVHISRAVDCFVSDEDIGLPHVRLSFFLLPIANATHPFRCFIVTVHTAVEIANFCIWRPPQDATLPQLPMKFYVMPIIEKQVLSNYIPYESMNNICPQIDTMFCGTIIWIASSVALLISG